MKLTASPSPSQARRIQIHLALIPVYGWLLLVWTFYAIDMSPSGRLDRSGHIKGHDFAHFYVLGEIANDHVAEDLYNFDAQGRRMDQLVPDYENRFAPIHGPQMSLLFAPFAQLPYVTALSIWLAFSAAGYAVCCFLLWAQAPNLRQYGWIAIVLAAGFPACYLLIAFGQSSTIALIAVTAAYFALRARRPWLAGLALGALFYKPSFGVALPFVLLYSREWRMLMGAATAVLLQLGASLAYYGAGVLGAYFETVTRVGEIADVLEPIPYQMQSLRSFFSILLPWPDIAFGAYLLTAALVIALTARCWRTAAPLDLRYSVLLLATVLANPHVNPYDLVIIAPVLILTANWALAGGRPRRALWVLMYLCFYLPGVTFLPTLTHIQVSVLSLVALTVVLGRLVRQHEPDPVRMKV